MQLFSIYTDHLSIVCCYKNWVFSLPERDLTTFSILKTILYFIYLLLSESLGQYTSIQLACYQCDWYYSQLLHSLGKYVGVYMQLCQPWHVWPARLVVTLSLLTLPSSQQSICTLVLMMVDIQSDRSQYIIWRTGDLFFSVFHSTYHLLRVEILATD